MKDLYLCPHCDWQGPLSATKGNSVVKGGCPHCWDVLGRFMPVRKPEEKKQTTGWSF